MAAQEIGSLYIGLGFDTAVFDRQIIQIPQKIKPASDAIEKGFNNASAALKRTEVSAGATRAAMQNLSFQLNDIGTSLASGGSPFRVLAQQSGQIVQIFQQVGFRTIATSIASAITPMRALVAGTIAAGAAFGGLILRAQSNAESLRQFNLVLERTGRLASNVDIGAENARLRGLGISRDLANSQRLTLARDPTLDPSARVALQTLGANLGAARGIGAEEGFKLLKQTMDQGAEATIRLALAEGALTVDQAKLLLATTRTTDGVKAQNEATAALDKKLRDTATNTVDPLTKKTDKLAEAWGNFVTKLSETKTVQNALDDLANFFNNLSTGTVNPKITGAANTAGAAVAAAIPGVVGTPDAYQQRLAAGRRAAGGLNPMSQAQARAALNSANPTAPTLAQATQAMQVLGFPKSTIREAVAAMGFAPDGGGGGDAARPWRSASEIAGGTGSRRFRLNLDAPAAAGESKQERDPQVALDIGDKLARQKEQIDAAAKSYGEFGVKQEASLAAEQARIALGPGATPGEREAAATMAAAAVYAKYNAELTKDNSITGMRIESERKVAQAMLESEGAAVRLNAAEQAAIETRRSGGGDTAMRTQQALAARTAATETSLAQGVAQGKQDIEVAQLRVSLLGQSTEYIERQIALLRVRQQVEAAGVPVAQSLVDARLKGVNALQDEVDLLARQQRVVGSIKEVAGVFENAFGRAFDAIGSGTFKLRSFIGDLLKDLGKTLASSAFKRLLGGNSGGEGLIGTIAGKLFPSILGKGLGGGGTGPFGDNWSSAELGMTGFATGGSFQVGGSGGINSQLVAFRATPGEMVDVSHGRGGSGGGADIIRIDLNPNEGWVAGVADQRIVTRSGQIVDIAVKQSSRTVQRNFAGMSAEAQARQL